MVTAHHPFRYGVNYLPLVPSAINTLVSHPLYQKTDFSSVVSVGNGVGYLPATGLLSTTNTFATDGKVPELYLHYPF